MEALGRERIYTIEDIYALPDGERAELIDGQIYYMAPPGRMHQKISWKLHQSIANYIDSKNGECEVYAAPDWIIEIVSPSSKSRDYMVKLFKYR